MFSLKRILELLRERINHRFYNTNRSIIYRSIINPSKMKNKKDVINDVVFKGVIVEILKNENKKKR